MTVTASVSRSARQKCEGPFANAAHELREYFLCPIPLGGDDGKKPLVRWQKHLSSADYIDTLIGKFPDANVGILCGPSKVTVIDIDDPGVASDPRRLEEYKQRFGDTPLIIRTPRDGAHLYCRSAGERNADLRSHGLPVDVKGIGGMVVVPPSIRPTGDHAGNSYEFLAGSWMDLHRLPPLKAGALSFDVSGSGIDQFTGGTDPENRVIKGMRNNALFYFTKDQARYCDNPDDLLDVARTHNMIFFPPLPDSEVKKVVRSVWGYYERGEIWTKGGPPRVVLTGGPDGDLIILKQNPDAFLLYCVLKEAHGARKKFAVSPKGMFEAKFIPSFRSKSRYRRARQWLIDQGLLIEEHKGGRGTGDPSLFRFPSGKGSNSFPNITNTPPPWGYGDD